MDRLTSMTTFVKVVEHGGFAAAARTLGIAPSAATNHVQALEERLGVRLLNRSTRKLSLTEIGESYFSRCLQILADMDEAERSAQVMHATPRGTLIVNTSLAIPALLAPVIAEYTALYPDIAVDLRMTDQMVDLVDTGADLAVRKAPNPDSSLVVRRVATFHLVVCGAPDYFSRHGLPLAPRDLTDHNCLIYPHSPWGNEWRFSGPDGEEVVPVTGNLRANSEIALRFAAIHGQGLCLAPSFVVADEIRAGRLIPILTDYLQTENPVHAIYAHRRHLTTKVRSFIDLMVRRFEQNPRWADACLGCDPPNVNQPPRLIAAM